MDGQSILAAALVLFNSLLRILFETCWSMLVHSTSTVLQWEKTETGESAILRVSVPGSIVWCRVSQTLGFGGNEHLCYLQACLKVLLRAWFCNKLGQCESGFQTRPKKVYVCSSAEGSWNTFLLWYCLMEPLLMNPACNGLLAAACSPPLAGTGIGTQQDTGLRNLCCYYSCCSSDWKSHCAAEHYKHALTDCSLPARCNKCEGNRT